MQSDILEKVMKSDNFHKLVAKKTQLSWLLSVIMLIVYFGFILIIAFDSSYLSSTISENSVITVGIPMGIGVILTAFVLTGVYVYRANTEFDRITREIIEEVRQ